MRRRTPRRSERSGAALCVMRPGAKEVLGFLVSVFTAAEWICRQWPATLDGRVGGGVDRGSAGCQAAAKSRGSAQPTTGIQRICPITESAAFRPHGCPGSTSPSVISPTRGSPAPSRLIACPLGRSVLTPQPYRIDSILSRRQRSLISTGWCSAAPGRLYQFGKIRQRFPLSGLVAGHRHAIRSG